MAKRDFYVRDSELDDFQVKVINRRTDNSFIVKGCAGSGKSILALWKAKKIQEDHMGTYLYIVYTKALRQYMEDGIREVGLESNNVCHYDACFYWTVNETEDPFGKVKKEFVRGAWKKGTFDYIIVDEAQDFSKEDILLFKSKAKKALLLYGDSAQQLYSFVDDKKTVSMEDIHSITGYPEETLVFNHRLPKKIARVAQKVNSANDDLEDRCTEEGEYEPVIMECGSIDNQLDTIDIIIRNKNLEDVGILFRNNKEVEYAYRYLTNKGLTVEAKYGKVMSLDFSSDNIKLMTYHSAKGLQFANVFVPDCSTDSSDDRNPLYVAITRPYERLFILHSGNLSSFFDEVGPDLYESDWRDNSSNVNLFL